MSADETHTSDQENRLVAERRAKLERLRETSGGAAFPNDFRRTALAGELLAAFDAHSEQTLEQEDVEVSVAGRMMAKRVMGRSSFVKIQDRSGRIQLFIERGAVGEDLYADFKKWDVGDIVGARGRLFRTRTGELSVKVETLRLLVKSLRPMPEKWHGVADQELKLRRRYLDLLVGERTREVFRARTRINRFMRQFLDALDFVEVETPMMHPIPGGAAARPFQTYHHALDRTLYLRIAPELYLKRLLVGGMERVYELNRVFRNEGLSTRHNPEFTMLELYQAYAEYSDLMTLTETLLRECTRAILGSTELEYQGERFDMGREFPRLRFEQALAQCLPQAAAVPGSAPLAAEAAPTDAAAVADGAPAASRDVAQLARLCEARGIEVHPAFGAGKLQLELFEKAVERELRGPVFVTHYPAEVSPLARRNDADAFVTDRFELFIGGREIANGFSELNDPEEQAARFREQLEAKAHGDEEAMFFDDDFITALEYGMPPAAGLGVGVDRLVMLLTDSPSIRDVLLFPQLR